MRARLILQVLSVAVIVAISLAWMQSRATAVDLQARLSSLTTFRRNTARALEQERERLRAELAEANLRRLAEAPAPPPVPAQPAPARPVAPSLALGEWRTVGEWRNEGRSTPQDAVATLVWAAAGGDVAALTPLIVYDEAARARARALFDTMPPSVRQAFPTPEALVAGLTIPAVPTSAVQLSWFHQRDADHATVGLLLGGLDQAPPAEIRIAPTQNNNPPMVVSPNSVQFTFLSLQRSSSGWRVAIPAAAIDRLAARYKAPAN